MPQMQEPSTGARVAAPLCFYVTGPDGLVVGGCMEYASCLNEYLKEWRDAGMEVKSTRSAVRLGSPPPDAAAPVAAVPLPGLPLPPIPGNPKLLTLEERRNVWLEIGAYFNRGGGRLTPAMVKMADEVGLERYEATLRQVEAEREQCYGWWLEMKKAFKEARDEERAATAALDAANARAKRLEAVVIAAREYLAAMDNSLDVPDGHPGMEVLAGVAGRAHRKLDEALKALAAAPARPEAL